MNTPGAIGAISLVLIFVGCATLKDFDPPQARPGYGYIDFFSYSPDLRFTKYENGKLETYYLRDQRRGILRVEELPGSHKYRARLGTVNMPLTVPVVEGKVTPVFLDYKIIDITSYKKFSLAPVFLPPLEYAMKTNTPYGKPRPPTGTR